ncbi:MAG: type II and III secretion system protein family protein [Rhodomicrobium sp.]
MLNSNRLAAPPRLWGMLAAAVLAAAAFADRPACAASSGRHGGIKNYYLDRQTQQIEVPVVLHKSETVQTDFPFGDAMVGDPEIADVVPLTNQSIYILGKKPGITRLSLLDTKKEVMGVIDIEVTYDLDILRRSLQGTSAYSKIKVSSMNGKILLSGVAPDAPAMSRALALAEQLAPHDVTNGMSVASPQQVMLEVRFIEATRDLNRGLGVTWAAGGKIGATTNNQSIVGGGVADNGNGNFSNNTVFNSAAGLASNLIPFGSVAGRVLDGPVKADVIINALEEKGLARKLAEPNLVALSGDTASFLAGGEFPFPVGVNAFNQVTIEFKKYGVGLAFTPTVLAEGQINLKIDPEVSELDTTHTVSIGAYQIPSLSVRRASTTIELRDGQTFMMAGLLQGSHIADTQQLPWAGDVPVLGQLFRSESFQKNETDLVILVTPRLVQPMVPGQKIATPLDNRKPANDSEFFLLGQHEVEVSKPKPTGGGDIIDLDPQPHQPMPEPAK